MRISTISTLSANLLNRPEKTWVSCTSNISTLEEAALQPQFPCSRLQLKNQLRELSEWLVKKKCREDRKSRVNHPYLVYYIINTQPSLEMSSHFFNNIFEDKIGQNFPNSQKFLLAKILYT